MIEILVFSLFIGLMAGFLAGLFGIGGGLVIVPALVILFERQAFPESSIMLMALGTSLATIMLTSLASARAHHRLGAVIWPAVFHLAPGLIVGTVLGSLFAEHLASKQLKWIFCVFLIWVALQMAFKVNLNFGARHRNKYIDGAVGSLIGFISALVGIGGGTLTVPYLASGQMSIKNAVAVSSACGFPIALGGAFSYAWLGWHVPGLPVWSVGYIYLPAFLGIVLLSTLSVPLGARLTHRLPTQKLKRYFALLLVLVATKMLW